MIKYLFLTFFLVGFLPINVFSQVILAEPRNKIDINVKADVTLTDGLYTYVYAIKSKPASEQNVWMFEVRPFDKQGVDQKAPLGWTTGMQLGLPPITGWDADSGREIRPGKTVEGFVFITTWLPGIADYYAEGWAPIPEIEWEIESISGYDDLTPYGPGVIGKTIGPKNPPADFKPIEFLNYIIDLKHQASSFGWITNKGIENSLDQKLDNAKKKLEQGNITPAKNMLNAFINEVEAQNGKHLTSEAYGLLKYNVLYLIEKLK